MKKLLLYLIESFILAIILIACAQWGGDNPLGITGGGEEGYGKNNNINLPDTSTQRTIDPKLQGNWSTHDGYGYIAITFYANGDFTISYHSLPPFNQVEGTYFTSGNTITLTIDGKSTSSTYSIISDQLLITINGERMLFHRELPPVPVLSE
jgi:hypothetical protein